jgi:hypothetical protein
MTLDVDIVYTKVVSLNAIYKLLAVSFFIWDSLEGLNIRFKLSYFEIQLF